MIQATLIKWGVIALIILAAFASGWVKGNAHGTAKLTDYIAKQATEAVRIAQARAVVTERVITKYVTKIVPQTEIVTKTIEKEVTRYAQTNPTGACIDADFIRLHNASAANLPPAAPSPKHPLREATTPYWTAYRVGGLVHGDAELRAASSVR